MSSVVLTFVAPARQCNQGCPLCLIDQAEEPVREFSLLPEDYARFLERFIEEGVSVRAVMFQGYEVTLPASWPYLDAVFAVAKTHDIRRSFITNGMLLHKWTHRIVVLQPRRISVSLDGSTAAVNDPIRGLKGALRATVTSVERFLALAPEFRARLAVASTVFGDENFESLLRMPTLLKRLGISRWVVSAGANVDNGKHTLVEPETVVRRRFEELGRAAERSGLRFHVNDEFGRFDGGPSGLRIKRVSGRSTILRLDPSGGIRKGPDVLDRWDADRVPRWDPHTMDPVDVAGF